MKILLPALLFTLFYINGFSQKTAVLPYATGVPNPIDLKHCGDERLFVVSREGRIYVVNPDATVRSTPFLDIRSKISGTGGEEGLLSMAFSPDYATSGKFYVDYTSNAGGQLHSVLEQYKVSSDPNIADASSAFTILTQDQPYNNHNGGNLMFGPDGYLYVNFGDGGSGGDPQGNGQNKTTFLGKILRIDVSNATAQNPYTIPATNPFYNAADPNIKKEIWAYGVRNPWRSSFDRLTGDLWIADVGQSKIEEIDFAPSGDVGGHNYGWNIMEGDQCYNPSTGCNTSGLTLPIYTYTHAVGNSITGGFVYRSAQSKSLFGTYIFSDYVKKWIDGIRQENGSMSGNVQHLVAAADVPGNPVSFGEDVYGDLYILLNGNSTIYKVEDTSYLRIPKAFFSAKEQTENSYLLQALAGRGLTYQWFLNGNPIEGETSATYTATQNGTYTLQVTNSIGNSDMSEAFILGTLPVQLGELHATKKENQILLEWNTLSEINVKSFEIQRKLNDEPAFSKIGFVAAKSENGSSQEGLSYQFSDPVPSNFTNAFYRIKMIDKDGSSTFSDIVSVSISQSQNVRIYPNLAIGNVFVDVPKTGLPMTLKIFDLQGRVLRSESLNQTNNKINLTGIKGMIVITISDAAGQQVYKGNILCR